MFFQAEDGIRDLVRSRGLGDVYKRQQVRQARGVGREGPIAVLALMVAGEQLGPGRDLGPVSYTHLTLPTSDLV